MISLKDGRAELFQWDTGRVLSVPEECTQVHFSNKIFGRSIDVEVVDGESLIPDVLLQTSKDITVWAFVGTAENGYTKISKVFKVNERNKPADYVFTPTEQTSLEKLSDRLSAVEEFAKPENIEAAVEEYLQENPVESAVNSVNGQTGDVNITAEDLGALTDEDLQGAIDDALAQAKESGEFDGEDGRDGVDGTSVSVVSIEVSPEDGGKNIVKFSDGTILTVRNGNKGTDGKDGANGADGINGINGINGVNGKDGISATHSWDGTTLTITSASGTSSADLKGERGEAGEKGEKGETGAAGANGKDGANGTNGKDGVSATHSWNGTVLSVTSASGTSSADLKGEKGDKGDKGDKGEKGDPYTLTEADKAEIAEQAVTIIDGIPDYWRAHLDGRVEDIRRAMEAAGRNKSAFLFYTDAHWTENHKQSPKLLKYLYNNTPINKVNYGGDIVQAEPTNDNVDDAIEMSYIYEWRKAIRCLPNHHSVVGNHDDGSAVNNRFADEYIYSYLLAPEENNDVVMGDGFYYYIDDKAERTRYLYLDTAYKMADTQQIEFVVNALNTTPADWHIVAISHIWHDALWNETQGDYIGDYSEAASKFLQLFYAYNHRINGETSGIAYDFSKCGGKVEFCIGGHAHWDYTSYYNDEILVILTETDSTRERVNIDAVGGTITENSVNAIVANYNDNTVSVIRVGRGESRVEEIRSVLPVAYTNVLLTAVDKDGSIFNACGYKTDTRYSNSSGGFVTANGVTCTGLIEIAPNTEKVIRFKNIRMNINDTASNVCHCLTFNGTLDNLAYYATMNGASMVENYSAVTDEEGNITQITIPAYETTTYMVFNTGGIGADSIITINEPIE